MNFNELDRSSFGQMFGMDPSHAYYNRMGLGNFNPQPFGAMQAPWRHQGGFQQRPGGFGQPQGGYDSSGINPHGMYTNQQFPRNPGGFQPMGLLARLSAYR